MIFRTFAVAFSAAILLMGCDPRTELEQEAPNISVASLRADGKAAIVAELFFDNRECFGGNIVLGSGDGTEVHDTIARRHWRAGAELQFAGSLVSAGKHYILRLDCSQGGSELQIAGYRRKPTFLVSPIYYPLGSFVVEPGEVVYIGSLHAAAGKKQWFKLLAPAAIGIEDRSEEVRKTLRQVSPSLAEAMVVRLAAPAVGGASTGPALELPPPDSLAAPSTDSSAQGEEADAGATTKPGKESPSRADSPCAQFVSGQNRSPFERAACEQTTPRGQAVATGESDKEQCSGTGGVSSIGRLRPWDKVPCDAY